MLDGGFSTLPGPFFLGGVFGGEMVFGGFFTCPGPGRVVGLGGPTEMDCGLLPEYQYFSHLVVHFCTLFAVVLCSPHHARQLLYPDKHLFVHAAQASLKKPNEPKNTTDKTASARTAGNLIPNFIICSAPPRYRCYTSKLLSQNFSPQDFNSQVREAEGTLLLSRRLNKCLNEFQSSTR